MAPRKRISPFALNGERVFVFGEDFTAVGKRCQSKASPAFQERHEIFQRSQDWRPAALNDAPVLGRIPLTTEITREHPLMADAVHADAAKAQAEAFMEIARKVHTGLKARGSSHVKRDPRPLGNKASRKDAKPLSNRLIRFAWREISANR